MKYKGEVGQLLQSVQKAERSGCDALVKLISLETPQLIQGIISLTKQVLKKVSWHKYLAKS